MIVRYLDKGDTSSVGKLGLVFNIDDPPSGTDGSAVYDDGEVVGFSDKQHVPGLEFHATETEVSGLSDFQIVEKEKGYGTFERISGMSTFFFVPGDHVCLLLALWRLRVVLDPPKTSMEKVPSYRGEVDARKWESSGI